MPWTKFKFKFKPTKSFSPPLISEHSLSLSFISLSQPELKAGQLCLARYSLDNSWYRAYVEKVHGMQSAYDVFFIDYGNREKVTDGHVRLMDGESLAAHNSGSLPLFACPPPLL